MFKFASMDDIPPTELPEVVERRMFPFGPSRLPSPMSSRCSSIRAASSRSVPHSDRSGSSSTLKYRLTTAGVEVVREPGPATRTRRHLETLSRNSGTPVRMPDHLNKSHRRHTYDPKHEMGHWQVANDVNPFLAHYEIPKWSTTAGEYGTHYRHPQQTYNHSFKSRMPRNVMHSRKMADRYHSTQGTLLD
mmetsp:Transcript_38538/g.92601  ORF Transcript_38538/g.92601 Transcript_38538/m.92601 type:complete len:190 (+) Transcript_38538:57-626(+)